MTFPFLVDAGVVARALNCSRASIYDNATADRLPFPTLRIGGSVRFKRVDIESYLGASLDEVLA